MGQSAGSAPEVQNVINYFKSIRPVIGAVDWHTYSQLLLRPYGWTRTNSPHEAQHFSLGTDMAAAIRSNGGMTYQNIKSIDLYVTTGTGKFPWVGEFCFAFFFSTIRVAFVKLWLLLCRPS